MITRMCGVARCVRLIIVLLAVVLLYGVFLSFISKLTVRSMISGKTNVIRRERELIYILQWTNRSTAPFQYLGRGNSTFVKNKCKHTNCYVTDDAAFKDITDFDAVIFNGRNVIRMNESQMPKRRAPEQKYIIAATESSDRFPACNQILDNFFNWTWTYKLNSDLRFGYITIYDLDGREVGPAVDMKWPKVMEPIRDDVKAKLVDKSKAAAWFVSNCNTNSKREDVVAEIKKELKVFGWDVDVYGACGEFTCPRKSWRTCDKKVEKDYYFYFAFENSFAEDYVTEKLLTALRNYAVPIVFGAADYSRFLPPNSYLNAKLLDPKNLARIMNDLISDKDKYYDYFRWRNHYRYEQTLTDKDMCKLCEALNDDHKVTSLSTWKEFRRWWNGGNLDKCL